MTENLSNGVLGAQGGVPHEAIAAFWAWWAAEGKAEAGVLFAGGGDQERLEVLGERFRELTAAMGGLAVATGPGRDARHVLVATAAGNPELQEVAAAWLAAAPPADAEFEYDDHRPPHPDPQSLALRFVGGELSLADTTIVTVTEGRTVHVQVSHPAFADLAEEDRVQITFLFLDAVLGERDVEERIGEIDVVAHHPLGVSPRPLLDLPQVLAAAG